MRIIPKGFKAELRMSESIPITQEQLMSAMAYDKDTGIFTWLPRAQDKFKSYRAFTAWNGQYAGKVAGTQKNGGYIGINIDRTIYQAHRLAWLYVYGKFPDGMLDHQDAVKNNNAIDNLRMATQSQNLQNQRKAKSNNKSGLLGVRIFPNGMFGASINHKHLGYFKNKEDAHECYLTAKRELHEFNTL